MNDIRKILDIINETTTAGAVSTVAQPMTTERREDYTAENTDTPEKPQVLEYGNWENSALTTSKKLKKSRKKASKIVKSVYGEDMPGEKKEVTEGSQLARTARKIIPGLGRMQAKMRADHEREQGRLAMRELPGRERKETEPDDEYWSTRAMGNRHYDRAKKFDKIASGVDENVAEGSENQYSVKHDHPTNKNKYAFSTISAPDIKTAKKLANEKFDGVVSVQRLIKQQFAMEGVAEGSLEEGVNDPHIFKAIAMIGPMGAGKSTIARQLVGGSGLRSLNLDNFNELLIKQGKVVGGNLTPDQLERSWQLTQAQKSNWVDGRLGLLIDGSGRNIEGLIKPLLQLEALGYDTMVILVNVSLETSLQRQQSRAAQQAQQYGTGRNVPADLAKSSYDQIQQNIPKLQQLYGNKLLIINNEGAVDLTQEKTIVDRFLSAPPSKPAAVEWIKSHGASQGQQLDKRLAQQQRQQSSAQRAPTYTQQGVAEDSSKVWAVTGTWTHRKNQREPFTTTTRVVANSPEEAMRKYKSNMWQEYERKVIDMKVKPYKGQGSTAVKIDEQGVAEGQSGKPIKPGRTFRFPNHWNKADVVHEFLWKKNAVVDVEYSYDTKKWTVTDSRPATEKDHIQWATINGGLPTVNEQVVAEDPMTGGLIGGALGLAAGARGASYATKKGLERVEKGPISSDAREAGMWAKDFVQGIVDPRTYPGVKQALKTFKRRFFQDWGDGRGVTPQSIMRRAREMTTQEIIEALEFYDKHLYYYMSHKSPHILVNFQNRILQRELKRRERGEGEEHFESVAEGSLNEGYIVKNGSKYLKGHPAGGGQMTWVTDKSKATVFKSKGEIGRAANMRSWSIIPVKQDVTEDTLKEINRRGFLGAAGAAALGAAAPNAKSAQSVPNKVMFNGKPVDFNNGRGWMKLWKGSKLNIISDDGKKYILEFVTGQFMEARLFDSNSTYDAWLKRLKETKKQDVAEGDGSWKNLGLSGEVNPQMGPRLKEIRDFVERFALHNQKNDYIDMITDLAGFKNLGDMLRKSDGSIDNTTYNEIERMTSELERLGFTIASDWKNEKYMEEPRISEFAKIKKEWYLLFKKAINFATTYQTQQGVAEGSGPQAGDEVYYGNRLVGWFKGYSKFGKIITKPNVDEMGDEYLNKDAYWDPQDEITIKPKQGVAEDIASTRREVNLKKKIDKGIATPEQKKEYKELKAKNAGRTAPKQDAAHQLKESSIDEHILHRAAGWAGEKLSKYAGEKRLKPGDYIVGPLDTSYKGVPIAFTIYDKGRMGVHNAYDFTRDIEEIRDYIKSQIAAGQVQPMPSSLQRKYTQTEFSRIKESTDDNMKLKAKSGDVEVYFGPVDSDGAIVSVRRSGVEIAQGDYDRHAGKIWIGNDAYDSSKELAAHYAEQA